jgi:hypothetical protein
MIVFGGLVEGVGWTNDVWVLENANGLGGTPHWTQLAPTGTPPSVRDKHTAVYNSDTNRMIVFGGVTYEAGSWQLLNDVWVLTDANGIVSPQQQLESACDDLQDIVDNNPGTPLADKVEDALAKCQTAKDELTKEPPDNQAAVGNIEGVVGDLEAAVKDELLDAEQGTNLMDQLAGIARSLAVDAIDQANADPQSDPDSISEAEQYLADGDLLVEYEAFKDAVNKYKDALAKAESALP